MSDTISQLEEKVNVFQVIREHPWPVLALAAGAGFVLARSKADVKAAAATVAATGGASNKVAGLLDELAARVITEVTAAANERVDAWVTELKDAIVGSARASLAPRRAAGDVELQRTVVRADSRTGESAARTIESLDRQPERGARSEGLH